MIYQLIRFRRPIELLAIGVTAFAVLLDPAAATTKIEGQAESLDLGVENASTREILDALSTKFKLAYSMPASAGRQRTGQYSGTLSEVLGRVLDGNDYIVELSDGAIKVIVFGRMGSSRTVAASAGNRKEALSSPPAAESPHVPPVALPAQQPSVPPLATFLTMNSIAGNTNLP
jgi:hypothetical protein